MASEMTKIALAVMVVAVYMSSGGRGQSTGCTRTLMGLSPCLNYVTGNSSTPTASCCSQLSNVVTSQPQCLCLLLNGTASSSGFNINQTLALQLPSACSVQTPPLSRCNAAANGPSASASPESPPSDASGQPADNIPSGSKTDVPTVNDAGSVGGGYNVAAVLLLLSSIAAAGF